MASKAKIFSHWYKLIQRASCSPLEFYDAVEDTIARRTLPGVRLSRVDWREGGWFSARRTYLRARRGSYVFDISAGLFGTGFFVSWWLGEDSSALFDLLSNVPLTGWFISHAARPGSFYKIDMALMFQETVHACVLEVIDNLTNRSGAPALTEIERQPILSEFFNR